MDKITQLRPNQQTSLQKMLNEPTKSILLASEQDQGKTLLSIEFALRKQFKRVLFVGIRDTFEQFRQRAEAQSDGKQTIRHIDTTKAGAAAQADFEWGAEGWFFIGQQLFNRRDWTKVTTKDGRSRSKRLGTWDHIQLDLLVYDEVHMAAGYGTNGQQTLHAMKPEWKLAMSGTFYGNKFSNAWSPTFWLWPNLVEKSFYLWEQRWVIAEPVLGRKGKPLLDKNGKPITKKSGEKPPVGKFVSELPCYIRFVGEEPVPEPRVVLVDLLPEQRRMYDALEDNALVWIRSRPFSVELPVTLRERLRTATLGSFDFEQVWDQKKEAWVDEIFFPDDAHSTKIDALLVELARYPDEKVVLGSHSKKFVKLVVARLQAAGLRAVEWSGDVSSVQRAAIKEQWLSGEVQYIVSVFKSFATGLDWAQTGCWRMGVLSEQVGDPTVMGQWVRRVFRTGPNKGKFEWFTIHARDTYDGGEFQNRELESLVQQLTLAAPVGNV